MDCPFFVQLNERSHPMEQILYKEYIQKKKDAYGQAAAALEVREDVSWDMLRSQINSGLAAWAQPGTGRYVQYGILFL